MTLLRDPIFLHFLITPILNSHASQIPTSFSLLERFESHLIHAHRFRHLERFPSHEQRWVQFQFHPNASRWTGFLDSAIEKKYCIDGDFYVFSVEVVIEYLEDEIHWNMMCVWERARFYSDMKGKETLQIIFIVRSSSSLLQISIQKSVTPCVSIHHS